MPDSPNTMTDKTNVIYVAQISLALPGRPETATAIVTLAPADKVELDDHIKPLAACTLAELRAYMDANFARATGRRRFIDRTLMLGEWPMLLKVMGKDGLGGRYLGLQDVIDLFKSRRFPARMNNRLRAGS